MPKKQVAPGEKQRALAAEIYLLNPETGKAAEPAEDCIDRLREAYAIAKAAHDEIYLAVKAVEQHAGTLPDGESIDCAMAARETAALAESIEKECKRLQKVLEKLTCLRMSMDPLADGKPKRGRYASGSPRQAMRTKIPEFKSDPEAYNALMDWLGVPEDLRDHGKELWQEGEFETEVLKINWNGFQDYLNKIATMGYELPPGCSQATTWTDYGLTLRKLNDLL